MTQEEKQLLLQDLCGRLPYGVKVKVFDNDILRYDTEHGVLYGKENMDNDDFVIKCHNDSWVISCEGFKPYLRPMSSMNSKEWMEYCDACVEDEKSWVWAGKEYKFTPVTHREEFLNSHHFDYRGLIPMGLSLEAPEEMYNTKTTCNNCEDKNYCSQSEYVKNNCYKLK